MKKSTLAAVILLALAIGAGAALLVSGPQNDAYSLLDRVGVTDHTSAAVKAYMRRILFDPDSLTMRPLNKPSKKVVEGSKGDDDTPSVEGGEYEVACFYINAKNRMGGYTGERIYEFLLKEGGVVAHFSVPDAPEDTDGPFTSRGKAASALLELMKYQKALERITKDCS